MMTIRPFQPNDFAAWLPLWAEYHAADREKAALAEQVFKYLTDPATSSEGLLALEDGRAIGFAHLVYHPSTYMGAQPVAFMEDLIVTQAFQGQQIGKSLIDVGITRAKEKGCMRFYWLTALDNVKAQRLYEHYAQGEDWVRYAISL